MHEGPSVTLLMTFPFRLSYTGLFLETLRSSWDLWWLFWGGVDNPKGETLEILLVIHFPNSVITEDVAAPILPAMPNVWTGGWLRGCHL